MALSMRWSSRYFMTYSARSLIYRRYGYSGSDDDDDDDFMMMMMIIIIKYNNDFMILLIIIIIFIMMIIDVFMFDRMYLLSMNM